VGDDPSPLAAVSVTDPLTTSSASIDRAGPGTTVGGRYTLRAAVGHGGMGAVWRATDNHLGREVAVKEVAPPPGISAEERDAMYQRMLREARAAAALSHPSVVQVYDVLTDGGRPWVVMELLDARTLAEIVLSDGPLAPRAVAKVGIALLGALEVAHAAGVLHRDVKPANVLVCTDGRCVLTDFGVARLPTDAGLTTPGMVLGSPHFISPERALGASFGPPSDLFSLGVTLFTAVEGQPPFDKGDPIATMHSVVEDEPLAPQRAGPLTEVLYGLLEKDPDRRWGAARSRDVLRELLTGPLASRTPMFQTDPMAVMPPRQISPPHSPPPATTGRVGGRALLPADEDPWLAPVPEQDPYAQGVDDPYAIPAADQDLYGAADRDPYAARAQHDPYQQMPDEYGYLPDAYQVGDQAPPHEQRSGTSALQPTVRTDGRRETPRSPVRTRATAGTSSRRTLAIAAAGLAVMLVVATVWAVSRTGDHPTEPPVAASPPGDPSPTASAPARVPLIEVQQFTERGIVVNLPQEWQEIDRSEIRVDFTDPGDASARIRLLQEPSGMTADEFLRFIEPNISCTEPYQRLDLSEIELAGMPGALLEYICGTGDDTRHTLWATVVHDGTAYSFFLSVRESQFEARKVIFEELVASFEFTG
jgi:eukaryotic-like serine/threonine-protein kinase